MKKILLLLLIIISIFSSCDNKNSKSSIDIKVNDIKSKGEMNFEIVNITKDDFEMQFDITSSVSNIEFLALETNEKCIIGKINKILSDTSCFIIHDKYNNSIYRFNKQGKFLNQIGITGNGPNEYKEAFDVSLNEKKHELVVLDLKGRKMLYYTYAGECTRTSTLPFLFTRFEFLTEDVMVSNIYKTQNIDMFSELFGYKLLVSDKNLNFSVSLPYKVNFANTYTISNPLRKFLGEIYYAEPFYDRIFKVNENETSPAYKFNFESNNGKSIKDFDNLNDQEIKRLLESRLFFNGEFVISDSILVFGVIGNNKGGTFFYSLNTKELKYDNTRINAANRFQALLFRSPKWLSYDNRFISTVNPYEFLQNKKYITDGGLEHLTNKEKSILLNAKESDNPVLMFYSLYEF